MEKQSSSLKSRKLLHHFHLVDVRIQLNILFDMKINQNKNSLHLTRAGDYDDLNEFWGTSCEACGVHVH